MQVIITSPSLDPTQNVSGVSAVTQFIIDNNAAVEYIHFELGKKDKEQGGWKRIPAILKKIIEWRRVLKQYPKAVIHYNFPLSTPSILRDSIFMLIARRMERKMVIHVHGGQFLTSPSTPWLLERIMSWGFNRKDPIIVLSDDEKRIIEKRFQRNDINILPNCIDLTDAKCFKRKIDSSILEIGYLGRIAESKGMSELLEACKILKRQQVPFRLHFAGKEEIEGQYIKDFTEALGDDFIYVGVVSGERKTAFLKSIDTFILPSYFEGLPMSLLEAMSFGCVPITTMVGSIPSVVDNGINGISIIPHSVDSIVITVSQLNEISKRQAMSDLAQKTIIKQFSPLKYIDKLNNIYNLL